MANKNWLIGFVLLALSAGTIFANGSVDERGYVNSPRQSFNDFETETFQGSFTMVDNLYPALVTDEGDTYYLMVHAPVDGSSIPEEGAALTVEAVRSPMSPVNLMVFSAEVDGEELEFYAPFRGGPGMMGGYGGYGGPGGMMGGYGGYGGPGGMMGGYGGYGCYGYDEGGWGNPGSGGWRR
ncbi:MAG: hypothetical protein RQ801_06765 [Spirochaetaceae bacterium]|nr:hypothetical protein [Spirochaetaceae bacterium]MDT8297982.1 hypothetical protein [Spirochaetaceae bacterium]